jgi:hypothetical protein
MNLPQCAVSKQNYATCPASYHNYVIAATMKLRSAASVINGLRSVPCKRIYVTGQLDFEFVRPDRLGLSSASSSFLRRAFAIVDA